MPALLLLCVEYYRKAAKAAKACKAICYQKKLKLYKNIFFNTKLIENANALFPNREDKCFICVVCGFIDKFNFYVSAISNPMAHSSHSLQIIICQYILE